MFCRTNIAIVRQNFSVTSQSSLTYLLIYVNICILIHIEDHYHLYGHRLKTFWMAKKHWSKKIYSEPLLYYIFVLLKHAAIFNVTNTLITNGSAKRHANDATMAFSRFVSFLIYSKVIFGMLTKYSLV